VKRVELFGVLNALLNTTEIVPLKHIPADLHRLFFR
jgi:hypothetical protein